ncbi:hypothetical protein GCM10023063_00010 [Arthrobacter methylotrophus]
MATSPVDAALHTTPDPRYAIMLERFGITAHEQLTCGFHVHTSVESPEEGVVVLDRIRDKLAVFTAISANSPYWRGLATGFESYRTQAWNRWPSSGPSAIFGSLASYRRVVRRLIETGVLLDEGMVYFDARLSRHVPTVEVRVADVCLRAEDAALIAVLVRALVETSVREYHAGIEPAAVPTVILYGWRLGRQAILDCAPNCWTSEHSARSPPRTSSGRWWSTWNLCSPNRVNSTWSKPAWQPS